MTLDTNLHQRNVMKAIAFIEENLKNPILVETVCEQVAMSPWQFQRVFRFLVGCPIGVYLRGRRLSNAFDQLLHSSEAKVTDLAYDFQFGSPEAFTRSFKNHFGLSPREAKLSPEKCELRKMPSLLEQKIEIIWSTVQNISDVVSKGPYCLVGLQSFVPSPFANDLEFENETMGIWKDFFSKIAVEQKSTQFSQSAFGVALNSKDDLLAPRMTYLACKEKIEFHHLPKQFVQFELPHGTYVQFSITGNLNQIKSLVDYVYAIWLPASGWKRSEQYDFEQFDFKSKNSVGLIEYTYNLPVVKNS